MRFCRYFFFWIKSKDRKLGLGFRRLSILDLSSAGHQPMADRDGRFWIVFNGEIYNFIELKAELAAQGHGFSSRSDTEVLLCLYKEFGASMLDKLRGMFAFAIWDERDHSLFLARDRAGKKPLYWTKWENQFIFASETKAILAVPGISRRINEEALFHHLTFLTTPAPMTLFQNINKLAAGHLMNCDAQGNVRISEYWDPLEASAKEPPPVDFNEACEKTLERLKESIKYRMVSDVPFGVFLSGGIDSSANVALMSRLMEGPVRTFSIGYPAEADYSELPWARRVAGLFKTDHREFIIKEQDLIDFLPKMVFHQDEPLADPVCVPVYFVSKLARDNGVIVCQVGEGSDELFCGYPSWMTAISLHRAAANPVTRALLRAGLPAARAFLGFAGRGAMRLEWLQRAASNQELFWAGAEGFSDDMKTKILSERLRRRFQGRSSWQVVEPFWRRYNQISPYRHPLQWMTYIDLKIRLPELLLMRVDKMSMANSVETRVPFLDHKFVETVLSIPPVMRLCGNNMKGLLKQSLAGVIPQDIINRPKQGFAVPIERWFWGALGQHAREALRRLCNETDYFDRRGVEKILARGNAWSWHLLNFALWHQRWLP
ncbi:MAG: asparagine synthase (glutamine-hydrolyzing) [Elusimicrobia bacterium]|nr:asparagine synthase (glutamine-hydrolyzing) [Elusimicrobiota bacterium]